MKNGNGHKPGTARRLVTLREASERFGLPIHRWRTLVQRGELPVLKFEGETSAWYLDCWDIEEWISKRKQVLAL